MWFNGRIEVSKTFDQGSIPCTPAKIKMKKLKIAILSPPYEATPPEKFGAIELVAHNLTEELVKRGHKVYLLATGNSKTSAELLSYLPKNFRQYPDFNEKWEEKMMAVCTGRILQYLNALEVDIVHNHCGTMIVPFINAIKHPVVTTIHAPIGFYNQYSKLVYETFQNANYISISNSQRKGSPNLNYVGTVYNGLYLNPYSSKEETRNYFAFLGRTSPEKGIKEAILIAKKAGVKLKIAAKFVSNREYFEKEIRPLIDGKQIEFLGEIGKEEKSNFLSHAIGLISPIQWEEPFGLVFIEAMAFGTPVISFNRGSVPEIIKNGETGFIIEKDDMEGMAQAVKSLNTMPKEDYKRMSLNCRISVEENFNIEKMADEYEKIYYSLLATDHQTESPHFKSLLKDNIYS